MPLQTAKRRKLNKEEPAEWKEIKPLSHKDYQISATQEGMLDSEATWFTPQNIHQYQQGPLVDEPNILPAALTTTLGNGQHPDLSSPEPSSQAGRRDESQKFHTQAAAAA